ncbi:murein DD-endopeptidase MepM/ murein hydrolase activator NlpD [Bacillus mesophilus]|uniref:M23 family metallopeptidase n=1 Tax=Bacillus mesophilus TaxID=1808955 RepID=A0A6M0Q214_9BACI|nr:M23 family metallopeptidase [Bacillus mesophilus]MBM7659528.1 murein DD-endopeptidase MepM/ murein hydrolase activator NlpD [Bacillus mesophilus]NEY70401.1 M23 family metallopeptidase [Bacillus mesophilus]
MILLIVLLIVVAGCAKEDEAKKQESKFHQVKTPKLEPFYSFNVTKLNNQSYISLEELSEKGNIKYQFDEINRVLTLIESQMHYRLVYGVPVYEKNLEYVPTQRNHLSIIENKPYISIAFLDKEIEWVVKPEGKSTVKISMGGKKDEIPVSASPTRPTSVEEIISQLSVLENPISGAKVSTIRSHLPGAPRNYRNGTHEGLDFYQYGTNVAINPNTPVYGMGEGKIIRIDHDYRGYSSIEERNKDLSIASNTEVTPEFILDKLRGKQVWVYYPNGILARFAHLDRVAEDLSVGDNVTNETVIGYVGNSGTSGEVLKNSTEYHLHLDLLIYNELFWEGLGNEEVITILTTVFE